MNIITQLQGGLGNQLFQYATARALSLQKKATLLLDSGWYSKTYEDVTQRELLLKELNTAGTLISSLPAPIKEPKRLRRIAQKFWPITPFIFTESVPYQFDRQLSKSPAFLKQNLYLIGYWQSYKYFESIKAILEKEVVPLAPLAPQYKNYLEKIQSTYSAMVHVRRGDYINSKSANKVHGNISLDYYLNGMNLLIEHNLSTHFFIFSDDLTWAKQNLPHQDRMTFIESLETRNAAAEEMELMKHCKSHLIANSSLSWWGAWLGRNPNAIVICPKHWTNDLAMNWDDLLPSTWIRL
jgi:hypothetical protein